MEPVADDIWQQPVISFYIKWFILIHFFICFLGRKICVYTVSLEPYLMFLREKRASLVYKSESVIYYIIKASLRNRSCVSGRKGLSRRPKLLTMESLLRWTFGTHATCVCSQSSLVIQTYQSAENRRKSVTDSGYANVTQWFWLPKFERQPQRK